MGWAGLGRPLGTAPNVKGCACRALLHTEQEEAVCWSQGERRRDMAVQVAEVSGGDLGVTPSDNRFYSG